MNINNGVNYMAKFTRQEIADIINREIGIDITSDDSEDVKLSYYKDGYKLHDWVVCDNDLYPFVYMDDKDVMTSSVNDSESESYELNESDYVDDSDIEYNFYPDDNEYYIDEQEIIDFANRLKRILNISNDEICLEVSIDDLCL